MAFPGATNAATHTPPRDFWCGGNLLICINETGLKKRKSRPCGGMSALPGERTSAGCRGVSERCRYCHRSITQANLLAAEVGRGTPVQLPHSYRFSCWHRHCLFSERIWMQTGHKDLGSRCERKHFRTVTIASRIARFDGRVHLFDGAHAFRSAARSGSQ